MNRPDKVIEAYEKAIEVNPSFPYAYMQLGQIFRQQGRFVEALEKMKKGLALKSKDQQPNFASDAWIKECEHLAELDAKLPEILSGKAAPANNFERLELARMCALYKKLNVAAVRLFSQAFSEQPQLADNLNTQDRYNAACAAALAGCGQGKDKDLTGDQERARLRGQALEWLRADLSAWRQLLDKERDKVRPVVLKTMLHWQQDTDFAVVRGMPALAKLPEAQRLEWQKLWADVADTLTRAQGDAAAEKKSDTK
jgi:serine/threonine-protein kinase